jgi:ribosomal protein S18 acetylase RimI-like enzyme
MERLDDMVIVAAGPGDAAALAEVHVTAWRETYRGLLPAAYLAQMNVGLYARRWRRQLMAARPPEIVLAAEGRDGLVGYCAGQTRPDGGVAEVSTLYVLQAAQKLGLGRRLLAASARVLQARGAGSLSLWVLNGNAPARGFYEHLGARAVAERAVRGWGGGYRETAYHWADIDRLTRMA